MTFLRLTAAMAITLLTSTNIFATCDVYEYKRDLKEGFNISLDNSCSTREIKELGAIGKDKVTVQLLGFSLKEVQEITSTGVLLKSEANDSSANTLKQIATDITFRLTANLHRLTLHDAKEITAAGSNVLLDNTFNVHEVMEICQKVLLPAVGSVFTRGFSGLELLDIASSGCTIIDVNEGYLNFTEAEKIVLTKGLIEIDSHFSGISARKLALLGKEKLTVDLSGFSSYNAQKIAETGVNITLDSNLSGFEARKICKLVKAPAIGKVFKSGFSDYDLKHISVAGCKIFYNSNRLINRLNE